MAQSTVSEACGVVSSILDGDSLFFHFKHVFMFHHFDIGYLFHVLITFYFLCILFMFFFISYLSRSFIISLRSYYKKKHFIVVVALAVGALPLHSSSLGQFSERKIR